MGYIFGFAERLKQVGKDEATKVPHMTFVDPEELGRPDHILFHMMERNPQIACRARQTSWTSDEENFGDRLQGMLGTNMPTIVVIPFGYDPIKIFEVVEEMPNKGKLKIFEQLPGGFIPG